MASAIGNNKKDNPNACIVEQTKRLIGWIRTLHIKIHPSVVEGKKTQETLLARGL